MKSHRKLRKSSQVVQEIGSYILGTYNVWLLSRRKNHDSFKYDRKDRGPITYCEVIYGDTWQYLAIHGNTQ